MALYGVSTSLLDSLEESSEELTCSAVSVGLISRVGELEGAIRTVLNTVNLRCVHLLVAETENVFQPLRINLYPILMWPATFPELCVACEI